MAQVRPVTSEALEAQIRNLLPSQNGFTEDLQASNVITPIIDLTAAGQSTTTAELLQTALAFGSQTAFAANNNSDVVANAPGFYRIFAASTMKSSTNNVTNSFTMTDGISVKTIWSQTFRGGTGADAALPVDFVVFLAAGESITAVSNANAAFLEGSSRQIADVNGVPVNPSGFTPQ